MPSVGTQRPLAHNRAAEEKVFVTGYRAGDLLKFVAIGGSSVWTVLLCYPFELLQVTGLKVMTIEDEAKVQTVLSRRFLSHTRVLFIPFLVACLFAAFSSMLKV